jgi:hypothetical protein
MKVLARLQPDSGEGQQDYEFQASSGK